MIRDLRGERLQFGGGFGLGRGKVGHRAGLGEGGVFRQDLDQLGVNIRPTCALTSQDNFSQDTPS
jgi:hypothetical protein